MTVYRNISNHVAVFNGVEFIPGESKDVDFFVMSPYMVEVRGSGPSESSTDKPKRRYRKRQKPDDVLVSGPGLICEEIQDSSCGVDADSTDDPDCVEVTESEQETSNIE